MIINTRGIGKFAWAFVNMHSLQTLIYRIGAVILTGSLLYVFGIVGFVYFHPVDYDPFPVSVQVSRIDEERIELSDGRVLVGIFVTDSQMLNEIRDSGGRIGLEVDEQGMVILYTRRPQFICGLGMPIITIPLIPRDVPKYRRQSFGFGRFVAGASTP